MAASKFPSGESPHKRGPLPARPAVARPEPSSPALQEKVLAEISHELGNFFHKLYYWSDYLQDGRAQRSPDATATQMLERTIRNFEDFLKTALEYFNPFQLTCARIPVADLVANLLSQVGGQLDGVPISVADPCEWVGAGVMIDPGRLSQALQITVRHLVQHVAADSILRVTTARAARHDAPGLEIGFELLNPNPTSLFFQTAAAGLEWAVAQKIVELHGGELTEREDEHGARRVAIFLPFATA